MRFLSYIYISLGKKHETIYHTYIKKHGIKYDKIFVSDKYLFIFKQKSSKSNINSLTKKEENTKKDKRN